jgi:hypothetical protein
MNLHEQVLVLVRGTSEKCVPEPGMNNFLSDAIIGLRRFSNSCRWKEFWRLKKLEEIRESDSSPKSVDSVGFFDSETIGEVKRQGLKTNLKAKDRANRVPKGSDDLEAFFSVVEKDIMDQIFQRGNGYKPNLKSEEIKALNKKLEVGEHCRNPYGQDKLLQAHPCEPLQKLGYQAPLEEWERDSEREIDPSFC